MTYEQLVLIITKYDIPNNVRLMTDSGWEGSATDIKGMFYNENENIIVFTQKTKFIDDKYKNQNWKQIF